MVNVTISQKKRKAPTTGGGYRRYAAAKKTQVARAMQQARARGGEMKYYDTELTSSAIPASTDWTATEFNPDVPNATSTLCAPAIGAAINQRIGREVKLHKININWQIQTPTQTGVTAGDFGTNIRLIVVQDMQTNAAQAQGEVIMQQPATASSDHAPNSFMNLANLGRFKIHSDQHLVLENPNAAATTATANQAQQGLLIEGQIRLRFKTPVSIRFNAAATAGGAIADIVDNSFCVYATCSSAGMAPVLVYQARAYYKE